ncbi:MAG: HEAT repeat domain-containing protein [Anaerolineales bacterium]|nr:HEAT repeat domain-containing protein [Anaerolineales bacterium]
MKNPSEIPFQKLLDAILDDATPFHPRYLYRLTDLVADEVKLLANTWPRVALQRRQSILQDLQELGEDNLFLGFEAVGQIGLEDVDGRVRTLAVQLLSDYENPAYAPIFMEMSEHDPDSEARAAAAAVLGTFIYQGEVDELPAATCHAVEECLLRVLNGHDLPFVRRRALEAFGFSSRLELDALIDEACKSGETEWLVSAIIAMGRSANAQWKPQVLAYLDHLRPVVRAEAASAAGELEIAAARSKLYEMLKDDDADVRMAAIWSLSQIGGEGVRPRLEQMLEQSEDDDEADLLEAALDNLSFTENGQSFNIFDLEETNELDEEDLVYIEEEEEFGDEPEDNEEEELD